MPFTKMQKAEGEIRWGGRLYRDEEFIFDLVRFQTSSGMPSWQLCIQVSRAEAELDGNLGVLGMERTQRMRREEDPGQSCEELEIVEIEQRRGQQRKQMKSDLRGRRKTGKVWYYRAERGVSRRSVQLAQSMRWSKMRLEKRSVVTLTRVVVFVICGQKLV